MELREEFKVIYLNRANHVLGINTSSTGSATGTLVCARHILSIALKANAVGIVLSHNHPSGNTYPSESDKNLNISS